MSKKFLSSIDLAKNELQNAVIHKLASAPSSPVEGQIYENSTDHKLYYHDGTAFRDVTYLAQVLTLRLDQLAAPNTSLSMGTQKIINVTNPTSAQDAATKAYVDSLANWTDWKQSVRVISTSNITLSGTQTIDGVSVWVGERVLVAWQTDAGDNGIYDCASGAWSRSEDANVSAEVTANLAVFIEEGTVYADTTWRLTTNWPITLGTTDLTFEQFGAGTSYVPGTWIDISGSTISIDTAVVARKYSANIWDNSTTSIVVTHNLWTRAVVVEVFRTGSPYDSVIVDVEKTTTNTVTLIFAVAPTTNEFTVVVVG